MVSKAVPSAPPRRMAVSSSRAKCSSVTPWLISGSTSNSAASAMAAARSMRASSAASLRSRSASTAFAVGTSLSPFRTPAQARCPLQVMLPASSPMRAALAPSSAAHAASRCSAPVPMEISTSGAPARSSCSADWVRYRPSVVNTARSLVTTSTAAEPVNPVRYRTFGSVVTTRASTSCSSKAARRRSRRPVTTIGGRGAVPGRYGLARAVVVMGIRNPSVVRLRHQWRARNRARRSRR